jgi:alanine racemase
MDMTMCDVSQLECREGDEVVIFGDQPDISELSDSIDTIPYEILSSVSQRVPRIFYQE